MLKFLMVLTFGLMLFTVAVLVWYGSANWRRDQRMRQHKRNRRRRR